jgi:hypothetical protein
MRLMGTATLVVAIASVAFGVGNAGDEPSAGPGWPLEPDSYRGLKWGSTFEQGRAARVISYGAACVCTLAGGNEEDCGPADKPLRQPAEYRSCDSWFNVGSVKVDDTLEFDGDGLAGALMKFPSDAYDTMRAVFVEKYGPPHKVDVSEVQNKLGATFKNESLAWYGSDASVMLNRFDEDLTKSGASILLNRYVAKRAAEIAARRKGAAKAF